MSWQQTEKATLAVSAGLLVACAAIGFDWVSSPYLKGYASAAGCFFVLSRVAASFS
jgi:hypothetical protein